MDSPSQSWPKYHGFYPNRAIIYLFNPTKEEFFYQTYLFSLDIIQ